MKKVTVSDDDLNLYAGRKIRIEKGDQVYVGTVTGLGQSTMAVSPTTVVRPWALKTEDQIVEFVVSDGWTVYELD
jgi:hypothetical protein